MHSCQALEVIATFAPLSRDAGEFQTLSHTRGLATSRHGLTGRNLHRGSQRRRQNRATWIQSRHYICRQHPPRLCEEIVLLFWAREIRISNENAYAAFANVDAGPG